MSTDYRALSNYRITKVLQKHFPSCRIWGGEEWFFSPDMLLAGKLHPLCRKADLEQIDRFGHAVTELWNVYSTLSFQAQKGMVMKYREKGDASRSDIEPFQRIRHNLLRELIALHRAVHGTNPVRYQDVPGATTDEGMIEVAKAYLEDCASIKERGVNTSRDQKAHLVQVARNAWERYKGKPAPKKNVASPFIDFVQDVIELAGMQDEDGWTPETVMKAWASFDRS